MLRKVFFLAMFLLSGLLVGCNDKKLSYLYLMLHPDYLQEVYNQCVATITTPSLPCEMIMRAQADFTVLENQREQDAERFGAQILEAQEASIYLGSKYHEVLKDYEALGKNAPSVGDLKNKRIELERARAEYEVSEQKVRVLLAVIAATSSI